METNGVGWIAAIIIGGLAGWLAEMFMKSNMGKAYIVAAARTAGGRKGGKLKDWHPADLGAVVLNAILQALNIGLFGEGWFAYLITGFVGACLLIIVGRMIRR